LVRIPTVIAITAFVWTAEAQPSGWHLIKDSKGVCQMSVPPDWKVNTHVPRMATGPELADAMILAQAGKPVRPMNEVVQNVVGVDKMLENTAQRVFWAAKPASFPEGSPPVVAYHVAVPAKDGSCAGQITIKQGGSEALVKQIAATVAPVKQ
jgi:hypothetical protein